MVAEDDEATARPQQLDGGRKAGLERVELLVDRDPERLEDPRRWVDPAPAWRPGGCGSPDDRRELLGRRDRRRSSGLDDRPGDPPRKWLLAVAPEQGRQLGDVQRRDEVRRRHPPSRVETHVERAAGPDPEPTFRVAQLEAG